MRRPIFALLLWLALWPATALAVLPDEVLDDPALEARARALSANIRCLVCQNESIDSSNADLARDLRVLVRERLVAGDSDREVLDYLVARYGDFVLFKPPLKPATYLLWFGPGILLLLGAVGLWLYFRRRSPAPALPLDSTERARLAELLGETKARGDAPPEEP
jgi:cytochrome c-type biogenesis protein CcmH